jgi:hypothetical protein
MARVEATKSKGPYGQQRLPEGKRKKGRKKERKKREQYVERVAEGGTWGTKSKIGDPFSNLLVGAARGRAVVVLHGSIALHGSIDYK